MLQDYRHFLDHRTKDYHRVEDVPVLIEFLQRNHSEHGVELRAVERCIEPYFAKENGFMWILSITIKGEL